MSPDDFDRAVELTVTFACVLFAIAAIVSAAYIGWIYAHRREDALFLRRLVIRDIRVAVVCAAILLYLVLALAGHGLGRPLGAVVIGGGIVVLMYGPTSDALLWHRERRGAGHRFGQSRMQKDAPMPQDSSK